MWKQWERLGMKERVVLCVPSRFTVFFLKGAGVSQDGKRSSGGRAVTFLCESGPQGGQASTRRLLNETELCSWANPCLL